MATFTNQAKTGNTTETWTTITTTWATELRTWAGVTATSWTNLTKN